jgi:purine-binding chemotaxis protein CheW
VPVLKNVLTEPDGIKTGDLFPRLDDLRLMHRYMHEKMGIGTDIDLRGQIIAVADLRVLFGMDAIAANDRQSIVVLESGLNGNPMPMGIAVDSVSDVLTIRSSDVQSISGLGTGGDTRHILGMVQTDGGINLLLNIEHVLSGKVLPAGA